MDKKEDLTARAIIRYVELISKSVLIRKTITNSELEEMRNAFDKKEFVRCIFLIQKFLGFEGKLLVRFYKESCPGFNKTDEANFLDSFTGDLIDNIFASFQWGSNRIAYIEIPANIPIYGTEAFKNFKFKMHVRRFLRIGSFEIFLEAVAHEICHAILYSIKHELRQSEAATDICVMVKGLHEVMMSNRRKLDFDNGYLTRNQFNLCYHLIISQKSLGFEKIKHKVLAFFWKKMI